VSQERFDRLRALKAQASAEFNLPESAERVAHIAALRMHHEALQERLVAGKPVETSDLLAVSRAIAELSPVPTPSIDLQFVRDVVDICPRCKWSRPAADKPEPPPSPSPPRTDPKPPVETKPPAPAPSMVNVVPIRGGPRSIHDGPYAPLKGPPEPWRGHTGAVQPRDPFPDPGPMTWPTPRGGAS
jgi:hypothetical protein